MIAIDFFRKMIIAYSPMFFVPPFKNLILKFNKKIHYFVFNLILILSYFTFFSIFEPELSFQAPIFAKGAGFLAALLYVIILYYCRNKNILK